MYDLFEQIWSSSPNSSESSSATSSEALRSEVLNCGIHERSSSDEEYASHNDSNDDDDQPTDGSGNRSRTPLQTELYQQLDTYQSGRRPQPTAANSAAAFARDQLRRAGIDPGRVTVPSAVFEPTEWSTTQPDSWHANIVARMINDQTYGLTPGARVQVDHVQKPFQSGRFNISNYQNRDLGDFAADIVSDCFDQYTDYIARAQRQGLRVLTISSGVANLGSLYRECLGEAENQIIRNPENREQLVRDILGNRADQYFALRRQQNAALDREVEEFRRENAPTGENVTPQQREEFERQVRAFMREQRTSATNETDDQKRMTADLRRGISTRLGLAGGRDAPAPSPDGVGTIPQRQLDRIRESIQRFENTTRDAANNGMMIVIASGNSGNAHYNILARSPHVISVGAADVSVSPGNPRNGHVAPFSSTGNPNYRNLPFESPTLVAPGSEVPLEFQVSVFGRQRTQNTVDGTSVAAPFVGATVGLMLTQNPDLTFEQVRDILRRNSQPLPIASLVERAVGMMGHNSPLGALVQEATLLNANAPQRAQGAGLLNVAGAVEDARRSTRNRPPAGPR